MGCQLTINQSNIMTTLEAYTQIIESDVFWVNGPKIELPQALIGLSDAINTEDETNWSIGECEAASLDSLIVGAYWSLTEWHGGQDSATYAALCALGGIFSPGMTSAPTEDEGGGEWTAYKLCNKWFEEQRALTF